MRTMGMRLAEPVLLLERREERVLVHDALVLRISMQETLAGSSGQHSITAVCVVGGAVRTCEDVVHFTHPEWTSGRCAMAFEELPPRAGVCRYCKCTPERACEGGCAWLDLGDTVCSSAECREKFLEEKGCRSVVAAVQKEFAERMS